MTNLNGSVKVNCNFCGSEMECPPHMMEKAKKHMCHKCFYDRAEKGGDENGPLENVHVDIPTNELISKTASGMTDDIVENVFPDVWSEKREELKKLSKKELACEMFGAGAYIALSNFMRSQHDHESKNIGKRKAAKE